MVPRLSPFRSLLIFPIVGIGFYLAHTPLTNYPINDYLIGTITSGNLFSASDYLLVTDVQRELQLFGQRNPISSA
jgi:hypothetical protein